MWRLTSYNKICFMYAAFSCYFHSSVRLTLNFETLFRCWKTLHVSLILDSCRVFDRNIQCPVQSATSLKPQRFSTNDSLFFRITFFHLFIFTYNIKLTIDNVISNTVLITNLDRSLIVIATYSYHCTLYTIILSMLSYINIIYPLLISKNNRNSHSLQAPLFFWSYLNAQHTEASCSFTFSK